MAFIRFRHPRSMLGGSLTDTTRYKDQQALKTHGTSERFTAFQKELEKKQLLRAPMLLKMVSEQAGFSSRL